MCWEKERGGGAIISPSSLILLPKTGDLITAIILILNWDCSVSKAVHKALLPGRRN